MKFLFSFCFLVALSTATSAKSMTWGKRTAKDRLLYRENVIRLPQRDAVQEVYVAFPKLGSNVRNLANVSAIFVYDRFTNSSGATPMRLIPTKVSANPRFNSSIIILQSKRSRGINSTVEFYGKKF